MKININKELVKGMETRIIQLNNKVDKLEQELFENNCTLEDIADLIILHITEDRSSENTIGLITRKLRTQLNKNI